jgi:hypothetical protein
MSRKTQPPAGVSDQLYDHLGRPFREKFPKNLSAKFLQRIYHKGPARVGLYDANGKSGSLVREELVRAQTPYVVVLLMYRSRFEITPQRREYYVYAPMELTKAAKLALGLWRRWEKELRGEFNFAEDFADDYPKVDDAAFVIPLADVDYATQWRAVRAKSHKCAGDPNDPFAFTCFDPDILAYKTADFQAGMPVKI